MKVIVLPIMDSGVPRLKLKVETALDEAILNAVLNRNGEAVQPDAGYTVIAFERNGDSFDNMTMGRNEDSVSGSATRTVTITGNDSNSYQTDELIGMRILLVFVDAAVRNPEDYTSNDVTGTIAFTSNIGDGAVIQILVKTLN